MTDKEWSIELFSKAAEYLDRGVTPEQLEEALRTKPSDHKATFDAGVMYAALRIVRSEREDRTNN